jgi:hypothetical protein
MPDTVELSPVDHDPFIPDVMPVDHDPFAPAPSAPLREAIKAVRESHKLLIDLMKQSDA